MGPCVGCTIYDPDTKIGLIAHIDSQKKAKELIRAIYLLKDKGAETTTLQATIHGGDQTEGSNDIFQTILNVVRGSNIDVQHASQGRPLETSTLQLDLRTGETSTFTKVIKDREKDDLLITKSRMSLFGNELFIEDLA